MNKKSAEKCGFGADQERGAFGSEREAVVGVFVEEIEPDERVRNGGEAPRGGACGGGKFVDGFRTGVERVEDLVMDGRSNDQRAGITPGNLRDSLRRDIAGRGCAYSCGCGHVKSLD